MSRRGNPSSLWRSLVIQRFDPKPGQTSPPPSLTAENDTLPKTIHCDWLHATRPVLCVVDENTGVWFVDLSLRKPEKLAAKSQQQQFGEVYFKAIRNASADRRATAACTVQPQHCGFLQVGHAVYQRIINGTQMHLFGPSSAATQQQQQQQQHQLPVGALATLNGMVMAFGPSEMLSSLRWTVSADAESPVSQLMMCNNVVPHFSACNNNNQNSGCALPDGVDRSAPFCFCVAWAKTPNVLFACFAHLEATSGATFSRTVRVQPGAVIRIQGSDWSPFTSTLAAIGSCSDAPFAGPSTSNPLFRGRMRVGWATRGRQVHALYVDTRIAKPESAAILTASCAAAAAPGFSISVDGPMAAEPIDSSASSLQQQQQQQQLQAGGADETTDTAEPTMETRQVYEAPFLFFREVMPCIAPLGPFAIDLDSPEAKAHQAAVDAVYSDDSSNSRSFPSVLGIPRTKIDTAVLVTRGAMARILMRKPRTASSTSNKYNNSKSSDTASVDAAAVKHWLSLNRSNGSIVVNGNASDNQQQSRQADNGEDDLDELEVVSQVEIPGGEGYIKTMSVSPSGTVVAFGFESGIIVVAFIGSSGDTVLASASAAMTTTPAASSPHIGTSFVTSSRNHSVPQLLFVARTVCRTPGHAPIHIVIDERRASILCLDCTGTLEMLLFPSDLRRGTPSNSGPLICSSVQRISVAQKVGPMDAPLAAALRPMRTPGCVAVRGFPPQQQQQQGQEQQNTTTHESTALKLCAKLEELETRSFAIACRSLNSTNSDLEMAGNRRGVLNAFHHLSNKMLVASSSTASLATTRAVASAGSSAVVPGRVSSSISASNASGASSSAATTTASSLERRNTAAAPTLDRHFFEGNFQPQFNPYTCVCLQDAPSSNGRLVDALQLLSEVEAAKAQAFARSVPSLAPSTVAAKFRAMKSAVAQRIRKFNLQSKEQQRKKQQALKQQQQQQKGAAADHDNLLDSTALSLTAMSVGGASPIAMHQQQLMPWMLLNDAASGANGGLGGVVTRMPHEDVAVDAESVHRAREALALARYLVPDHATATYCSPYSVPP